MIKRIFFLAVAVLTFNLALGQTVFAIGMITEPIILNDVLRGSEVSEIVTVFNPESTEVVYKLGTDGDIKGWVEFFEKDNLSAPVLTVNVPAKTYYDAIAKVKVPDGTPNGEYVGEIFVMQEPKEQSNSKDSSVSVSQKVSREVRIKVTDQEVLKLDTTLIPETYDVRAGDALRIKIVYENLGNVSVKPDLQLKIVSIADNKTVFNAIFPYSDTEEAVKPGERKTMPVFEWPTTGQKDGKYRAEVSTKLNGKTVQENSFKFNIGTVVAGNDISISDNKFLAAVSAIGNGNLTQGWFTIGGVLLILAAGLAFLRQLVSNKKQLATVNTKLADEKPLEGVVINLKKTPKNGRKKQI